jgi:hypothetical protein
MLSVITSGTESCATPLDDLVGTGETASRFAISDRVELLEVYFAESNSNYAHNEKGKKQQDEGGVKQLTLSIFIPLGIFFLI